MITLLYPFQGLTALTIQKFATVMMQETLALVANLDICQCGKMEGSDVKLVHVKKLALHHVPKTQLVTCAIVILVMMESNVRNALLITTYIHFLIVQEVNQVSKIVKTF